MNKTTRFSNIYQADAVYKDLKTEGYVILKGVVPISLIEAVNKELAPYFANTPNCEGLFYGYKSRRISSVFRKSKASQKLATHPLILKLMERVLGPFCDCFQINLTQGIRIFPGEKEQVPHSDDELFPWSHPGMDFMVNCMWALDPFTPENGGTRVWPRSNLLPVTREPDYSSVVKTAMKPGDVLLYLGSTLHCGGENISDKPRTGLVISYNLGWLRQAENQYLVYPPEVAKRFPKKLQALVGYAAHKPNVGWYEGQDPSIVLRGQRDYLPATDLLSDPINEMLEEHYRERRS